MDKTQTSKHPNTLFGHPLVEVDGEQIDPYNAIEFGPFEYFSTQFSFTAQLECSTEDMRKFTDFFTHTLTVGEFQITNLEDVVYGEICVGQTVFINNGKYKIKTTITDKIEDATGRKQINLSVVDIRVTK